MKKYTNKYGKECYKGVNQETPIDALEFHIPPDQFEDDAQMEQMQYSKEFERYYREIDPDVDPFRFSKGETGFYKSKHTYEEYKWFVRGYVAATKASK